MPRLSVWFVRFSFIHLFLGFTLGGFILANKGFPFMPWVWKLLPAHMDFLLLGWMVQLAMGVAFWILPRFRSGLPRGNENIAKGVLLSLNIGVFMVAIQPFSSIDLLALAGRILEATSVLLFVLAIWHRVKPIGT